MMKLLTTAALLIWTVSAFAELESLDSPAAIYAICSASNAILSTRMEDGMLKDMISSEALRHASSARALGATDDDLRQFVEAMSEAYNSGKMSWQEIGDLGQECASL
jgi:hypothetical protein